MVHRQQNSIDWSASRHSTILEPRSVPAIVIPLLLSVWIYVISGRTFFCWSTSKCSVVRLPVYRAHASWLLWDGECRLSSCLAYRLGFFGLLQASPGQRNMYFKTLIGTYSRYLSHLKKEEKKCASLIWERDRESLIHFGLFFYRKYFLII